MKKIKTFALIALTALLTLSIHAQTAPVVLEWDAPTNCTVSLYKVFWGSTSTNYTNNVFVPANQTVCTISNLPPGRLYFAAKCWDIWGLQSIFSNEICVTVTNLPPPPANPAPSAPGSLRQK